MSANTVLSTNLVTSLSSPPDVTQAYYLKQLLTRAKQKMYYSKWADDASMKTKQGKTIIMRRYQYLTMALSPLAEGTPPSGQVPALTDYQATLKQFGDYIILSDFADLTGIDDYQTHWSGMLGDQAGYTMDAVDRDVATAATNIIYTNGTAATDIVTVCDGNDLDRAIRVLVSNGAETLLGGNSGSTTIGSGATMPAYPAVTGPEVLFSLQNITGFKWACDYKGASEDEVARYKQIAFFQAPDVTGSVNSTAVGAGQKIFASAGGSSTAVKNTAGTVNVYSIMIFAKHGFTRVPLSGQSTKMYRKPFGSAGVLDPIDQISSMGWKNTSARLITNQNWLCMIKTAAEL